MNSYYFCFQMNLMTWLVVAMATKFRRFLIYCCYGYYIKLATMLLFSKIIILSSQKYVKNYVNELVSIIMNNNIFLKVRNYNTELIVKPSVIDS